MSVLRIITNCKDFENLLSHTPHYKFSSAKVESFQPDIDFHINSRNISSYLKSLAHKSEGALICLKIVSIGRRVFTCDKNTNISDGVDLLSGKQHRVWSCICILKDGVFKKRVSFSRVKIKRLSFEEKQFLISICLNSYGNLYCNKILSPFIISSFGRPLLTVSLYDAICLLS